MAFVSEQSPRLATRLTDYWITVFKRTMRGVAVTNFLMPVLYLAAMGVGLGHFVDKNSGTAALGGVTYLAFIAPGLLATTAMQTAIFESTYPVMGGFKWHRVYYSMAATPLRVADIVAAQLGFIAVRIFLTCAVFVIVMGLFGVLTTWWGGVAALGVVILLGMAYAAPMCGLSARLKNESGFSLVFRLGLIPMMLFSGAFFPVSQLGAAAWLAYVTPIWHGVELSRQLTTGHLAGWAALGHIVYLLAWLVAGWYYSLRGFQRRLAQ
ncbi:MAG: ABC transporter permease [Nocardioidaceae bacterium]